MTRTLRYALVVFCGAALGTFLRAAISFAHPTQPDSWPWATFAGNLVGAFILGVLLESLASSGPDDGWRRIARLNLGTGILGGFTTYSTYVLEITQRMEAPVLAISYALVSTLLGIFVAGTGVVLAGSVRWRHPLKPERTAGAHS